MTAACLTSTGYSDIPHSSRSCRTAASPMLTSIAIERQMLDFFLFFLFYEGIKPEGRLFWKGGVM
jgi:hypothetical protein